MRKFGLSVFLFLAIVGSYAQKKQDKKVGAHIYDRDTTIISEEGDIYKVENLGNKINSRHIESGPRISPDGKSLYFFRVNHPKNYSHTRDIWVSHYIDADTAWGEAEHLKFPLNNYGDNSVHSISPDGKTLLLHNVYLKNGLTKNGVSISHYNESKEKWGKPEEIKIKGYHNDQVCSFYLCTDQKTMILAIHGKETFGEQDLYVIFKDENEKWSKPLNMGPVLNTPKSEATAFMFTDGETLYYSSNGLPNTLGGYDIYKTTRLDSTWTNWSKPVNMGSPWNTKDDEFYFSIPDKGDYSYLSHHFTGMDEKDHSDLVRIKMTEHPSLYMHGLVYDFYTKKRIDANVVIRKTKPTTEEIFSADVSDSTTIDVTLNSNAMYEMSINKEGYLPLDSTIDLMALENRVEDTVRLYIKQKPRLDLTIIAIDAENGDTIITTSSIVYKLPEKDKPFLTANSDTLTKRIETSLPGGSSYDIKVGSGDYYVAQTIEGLDLTELQTVKDSVITVQLKPIMESVEFDLPNIYFIFAKTELDPRSNESLDELVQVLNEYQIILKAEIGGHTDARGSNSRNQTLSEGRSKAIVDYLVSKGIKRERLVAKGYGETEITNGCTDGVKCSEEQHLANRRVVLKLLDVKKVKKSRKTND
jgi:outer membrane protein OmpA-like peptidoglycan-associated protein